jgi:hypothetical protein
VGEWEGGRVEGVMVFLTKNDKVVVGGGMTVAVG